MIRTRRVLALSNNIENYLIIFTLFFTTLFLLRFFWPVTPQYDRFLSMIVITLSSITAFYGAFIIFIILLLLVKDHIFLIFLFIKNLIKIGLSISIIYSTQFIVASRISGMTITL